MDDLDALAAQLVKRAKKARRWLTPFAQTDWAPFLLVEMVANDLTALRSGVTRETLLSQCLGRAPGDPESWREYVDDLATAK